MVGPGPGVEARAWCSALAMLALSSACGGDGGGGPGGVDGGAGGDAAGTDSGSPADGGGGPSDGATPEDGGMPGDAAPAVPEVCSGGGDEDGDGAADCEDTECWPSDHCPLEHVRTMFPGLVACGDVIRRTAEESAADCPTIGMPPGSMYPTECGGEVTIEATVRIFCDGDAPAAAWVHEHVLLPERRRMLSERRLELIHYERASVVDWERRQSGGGGSSGPSTSLFDVRGSSGSTPTAEIVTVRGAASGESFARLLGLSRVTSILDLDAPMSMDSRTTLHVGATLFNIP